MGVFRTDSTLNVLVKRIGQPGQSTNERFRIVISDGINYQQAMLATQQVVPLRPVPVLPTPPI